MGNFVEQDVSDGVGTVTLGTVSGANRQPITSVVADGFEFEGIFHSGNDREISILRRVGNTIERVRVKETLIGGAINRTNPTPVDLSSATLRMAPHSGSNIRAGGLLFQGAPVVGRPSFGLNNIAKDNVSMGTLRKAFIYNRETEGWVSEASILVQVAVGAVCRISANERLDDCTPGKLFGEFTSSGTPLDCSTTGPKTATPAANIWLPGGEIFIIIQFDVSGISLAGDAAGPNGPLGWNAAGVTNGLLYRSASFASMGEDEGSFTWQSAPNYASVLLRDV